MSTLLCFGEALIDFLPQSEKQLSYQPMCGGAPANVAVAYAKLSGKSYLAGGISSDCFGQLLTQQLTIYNVKMEYISIIDNHPTAIVLVNLDSEGEREFTFYRHNSADMYYQKAQIDSINWTAIDIFHFCSNTLTNKKMTDVTRYALHQAIKQQTLICFDINLRQSLWQKIEQLPTQVEQCFSYCDILKFSKDELDYLAEEKCLPYQDYISYCLQQGVSLILVTDGANNIDIINRSSQQHFTPPTVIAVDTTGAGDSFIAGFLYALGKHKSAKTWLNNLVNVTKLHRLLDFASQCSAITCTKKGAFSALPSLAELNQSFIEVR